MADPFLDAILQRNLAPQMSPVNAAPMSPMPGAAPVGMPSANPFMPMQMPTPTAPAAPTTDKAGGGFFADFANKVKTDPAFAQSLIMFGSSLMQPIQPGQTAGGNFGKALAVGLESLNTSRAAKAAGEREDRKIGVQEGGLGETKRQFDAAEELRKTEAQLQKAQAGYYDRMPKDGGGDGGSKTAEASILAKSLILAEKQAIAEGRLDPKAAKYQTNPALANVDAIERLNPNNALDAASYEAKIREVISPYLDLYNADAKAAIEAQITKGKEEVSKRSLGSQYTAPPGSVPGSSATGSVITEKPIQTATNDKGQSVGLFLKDGSYQWLPL